jgi:MoaA/NifB/PqqE/SkfB family radical SAM enzyme
VSNITILNLKLLEKYPNLKIVASIDGTGKIYEWIRGYEFNKISKNIDLLLTENFLPSIQFTGSVYNLENLQLTHDYFTDKGIKNFSVYNATDSWLNIYHLSEEKFNSIINNLAINQPHNSGVYQQPSMQDTINFKKYTDYMNKVRGLKWQSINPLNPF